MNDRYQVNRYEVIVQGHQHYHRYEGKVLAWTTSIEYHNPTNTNVQVPAVILETDDGKVHLITIKGLYTWTKILNLEPRIPDSKVDLKI